MLVDRFDYSRLPAGKAQRTPQGFLRTPASFTRAGVFVYQRADGSTVRELRPESEVFAPESLATLQGAPLTLGHPAGGRVDPSNARALSIGFGGDSVAREDHLVLGSVTITDPGAIDKATAKELAEISAGYQCRIDSTPGVDPVWGPYDQVQRGIVYNHLALGGHNWGRAGADVSLRLDSNAAIQVQQPDNKTNAGTPRTDSQERIESMIKITLDGVQFEIPENAQPAMQHAQQLIERRDSAIEKLQGAADATKTQIEKLQEQLAEATDQARLDSAVSARFALVEQARGVLGAEFDATGKTDREIQEAVIRKDSADLDLSEKSTEYVAARYDAAIELIGKVQARKDSTEADKKTAAAAAVTAQTVQREDSKSARQRMLERNRDAWQEPLDG